MAPPLTAYVNSTMNEVHDHVNDLYEAMMDMDRDQLRKTIINLKKVLTDVNRAYETDEISKG